MIHKLKKSIIGISFCTYIYILTILENCQVLTILIDNRVTPINSQPKILCHVRFDNPLTAIIGDALASTVHNAHFPKEKPKLYRKKKSAS